jgi:hypothetical protein
MRIIELKSNLHKLIDRIEDQRLLRAIYTLLESRGNSEAGRVWQQLTDEQKNEVLQAYDESKDGTNLIENKDIWKDFECGKQTQANIERQ